VQIDHINPRSAGGPSTVENCRLACANHNDLAARRFFGDARSGKRKNRAHIR
jgi:5-methylcytosine-specific restriction endonuclease McrA